MSGDLRNSLASEGFALIPGFYDVEAEIEPIREDIRRIIALVAAGYSVDCFCGTADDAMADGYSAIAKVNRSWASEIYDAVKMIPAFSRLVADPRNAELFRTLRPGSFPGIAGGGAGIRIDSPDEEKFRAYWHQEFPAQLRSPDGIVFWSPLVDITPELGPVEICPGSHREGLMPVIDDDGGVGRSGAYALRLQNEAELLTRYPKIAPLPKRGDLLVMDFLTLHQSGFNRSNRPRWSMQFRYFNFLHPVGQSIAWSGSYSAGVDFRPIVDRIAKEISS